MKNNKFLRLMATMLSVSILASGFAAEPIQAKVKLPDLRNINLSKKEKIGIGVGVPSGTAVVIGIGIIGKMIHNHNKRKNVSKKAPSSSDDMKEWEDNFWDILVGEFKNVVDVDEDLADWAKENYPELENKLSQVKPRGDSVVVINCRDARQALLINVPDMRGLVTTIGEIQNIIRWLRQARENSQKLPNLPLPQLTVEVKKKRDVHGAPHTVDVADGVNSKIRQDLLTRAQSLKSHKNSGQGGKAFTNNWEQLCYLLGSAENVNWVQTNYPEWVSRLSNSSGYGQICQPNDYTRGDKHKTKLETDDYENFALMSIAYSLLLAKAENYCADDPKNNELIVGRPTISFKPSSEGDKNARRAKIKVLDEDILCCAQKHFDEWGLKDKKIGFLNAGDPYDPNGFLPNRGCALEEYLSMNTTLVRDLSHKEFRKAANSWDGKGFYTTRGEFPPVVNSGSWDKKHRRYVYEDFSSASDRLFGTGEFADAHRDFFHERGIMSKNVRLIRPLGSTVWKHPIEQFSNFDVTSQKLADKAFCVLSIAGLEDRSGTVIMDPTYREKWKEITKKQCRFALEAFIREGVRVPFLCAFSAGCFGGSATIVAECFRELLIDEGYADAFDTVVFPIIGGQDPLNGRSGNIWAFRKEFLTPIPAQ